MAGPLCRATSLSADASPLPPLLRKRPEQVAQVSRVGGVAQQRTHTEDLLQRAQGGAVRVVDGRGVAVPPGDGREDDQANWTITVVGAFVPQNEERSAPLVGLRAQDQRNLPREPAVALFD